MRESFFVYRVDNDDTTFAQDWVLVATKVSVDLSPLGARQAAVQNESYSPRYPAGITHLGRCRYHESLTGRPDAVLLVSEADDYQYVVVRAGERKPYPGADPDLTLSLSRQKPAWANLKAT